MDDLRSLILDAWRDATNLYLAGAGLPPLKEPISYREPESKVCPDCGEKHTGPFIHCSRCKDAWDRGE